ncbi:hypothetical protein CHS0354_032902 [Potamilus streckersoni]|uniref:TNFR-Cys domain-containing protein n=1 Tax=Potamilus streckersoni TaxID=2493646 RepID=A0AAE0VK49_9BIVA|nr:hypothetical protein CHS0354_032902 [Potamilus streckersoni]
MMRSTKVPCYLLLLLECTLHTAVLALRKRCPPSEYFDTKLTSCQPCKTCPRNTQTLLWCGTDHDTVCGKSNKEWHFLNNNKLLIEDVESSQYVNIDTTAQKELPEVPVPPEVLSKDSSSYWRSLAFALIGILCAMVLLTGFIFLMYCRFCRHMKESAHCNEGDDVESGYVVIHKFPPAVYQVSPPSSPEVSVPRGPVRPLRVYRNYRPKRRLLNEYVDDVFESEDSAGSHSLRLPLETIPEKSDSDGATSGRND